MIGNRTSYTATPTNFTTNVVFASVGLTSPIAAGERQQLRIVVPITVGATGGAKCQLVVPAGVTLFNATITINNAVAGTSVSVVQTASASFGNALANAGNDFITVNAQIINGVNPGVVDLQIAQNSSDVNTLSVLSGNCDVIIG